jgi:hypothetical protein
MLYQPVENSPDDAVPMEGVFAFLECNSQRCQLHAIHPAAVCYRRSGGGSRVAVWISRSGQRDGRGVRGTVCWLLLQQMVAHALPGGGVPQHTYGSVRCLVVQWEVHDFSKLAEKHYSPKFEIGTHLW